MSKNRSQTKSEIEEENVLRAINMVEAGNCNARQAAEICRTSFYKVRSRLRGHKPKHERKGANTLLFEEEEKALCLWIGYLQDIFLYPSRAEIELEVNRMLSCRWKRRLDQQQDSEELVGISEEDISYIPPLSFTDEADLNNFDQQQDEVNDCDLSGILQKKSPKIQRAGKKRRECGRTWVTNFLKRHPEYKLRTATVRDIKRSAAEDESLIETWFSRAEQKLTELKVDENNIYNCDEHNIRIGVGGKQKVVAPLDVKQPALGTQTGRESATILETICANGKFLPPLIIFKGMFVQAKWIYENAKQNLPKDYLLATSKKSYIDGELFYGWLRHFNLRTRKSLKSQDDWRILFLDNAGAHVTNQSRLYASNNRIQLYSFIPHSTHFSQPLDKTVFSQYKEQVLKSVGRAYRFGTDSYTKVDLLNDIHEIRCRSLQPGTIKRGFRETGLVPWNPECVLALLRPRIQEKAEMTDEEMPAFKRRRHGEEIMKTPTKIRDLELSSAEYIEPYLKQVEKDYPDVARVLGENVNKIIKSATVSRTTVDSLNAVIKAQSRTDKARKKIHSQNAYQLKVSGALEVGQGCEMIQHRMIDEGNKIRARKIREARRPIMKGKPASSNAAVIAAVETRVAELKARDALSFVEPITTDREEGEIINCVFKPTHSDSDSGSENEVDN